jgi:hypothetical protein
MRFEISVAGGNRCGHRIGSRGTLARVLFLLMVFLQGCDLNRADLPRSRDGVVIPLLDLGNQQAIFVPVRSGQYSLSLDLPLPIHDGYIAKLVTQTETLGPSKLVPKEFDLSWSLLKNDVEQLRGAAANGIIGITESGPNGLGGYPRSSVGFVFARVGLDKDVQYTLKMNLGSESRSLLGAHPIVRLEK